jgi:hypothetical protein
MILDSDITPGANANRPTMNGPKKNIGGQINSNPLEDDDENEQDGPT